MAKIDLLILSPRIYPKLVLESGISLQEMELQQKKNRSRYMGPNETVR